MLKKKILFIVSNSKEVGFGHLKRCIVLSKKLNIHQNILMSDSINFIDKRVSSNFYDIVIKRKFTNKIIKDIVEKLNPSFVIFDTFVYKFSLFRFFKKKKISTIQFINNNYKFEKFGNYLINSSPKPKDLKKFIINRNITQLNGARYSIIDTNKIVVKNLSVKNRRKKRNQIFFCLGGSFDILDVYKLIPFFKIFNNMIFNIFLKISETKHKTKYELEVNKLKNKIKNVKIILNKDNILKDAKKADFAIVSGGTILTEMIFMKIPALVFAFSKNQEIYAKAWQKKNCCLYEGYFDNFLKKKSINQAMLIKKFIKRYIFLIERNMKSKIDSLGSDRISNIVLKNLK